MIKRFVCLAFFFTSLFMSMCFANDNEVRMDSVKGVALLDSLSASAGEGEYKEYLKLNGYPGQDKFQIYYQDSSHDTIMSFQVKYEDLRGINLDEIWDFTMPNGTPMKLTRRQVYNVFSLHRGTPVEKYIRGVFPGAYDDWLMSMSFSQDANRLVERYLEKQHGIKWVDRFAAADIKIESRPSNNPNAASIDGIVRR